MAHLKLGEILIKEGFISEAQLQEAIKAQAKERGRIGEVLIKLGILSEQDLISALGTQLKNPPFQQGKRSPPDSDRPTTRKNSSLRFC